MALVNESFEMECDVSTEVKPKHVIFHGIASRSGRHSRNSYSILLTFTFVWIELKVLGVELAKDVTEVLFPSSLALLFWKWLLFFPWLTPSLTSECRMSLYDRADAVVSISLPCRCLSLFSASQRVITYSTSSSPWAESKDGEISIRGKATEQAEVKPLKTRLRNEVIGALNFICR